MTRADRASERPPAPVEGRKKKAKAASDADGSRLLVQVGWMNPKTGVMCDCPLGDLSPHANSVPVYKEVGR